MEKERYSPNKLILSSSNLFASFTQHSTTVTYSHLDYIPESQIFVSSGADRLLRFHLLPSLSLLRSRSVVAPQMAFAHIPPTNIPAAAENPQLMIPKSVVESSDPSVAQLLTQTLAPQSRGNGITRSKNDEPRPHVDELYQKGVLYSGGQGCSIYAWDIGTV